MSLWAEVPNEVKLRSIAQHKTRHGRNSAGPFQARNKYISINLLLSSETAFGRSNCSQQS